MKVIKLVKSRVLPKFTSFFTNSFSDKYLFYTNVGISMALSGFGDIIEQNYEILTHELDKWDQARTCNMSVSGLTVGILCHHWYNFLDKRLAGYTLRVVAKKICVDQLVGSPLFIATFFVTLGLLERKSKVEIVQEAKQKAWRLYAAEFLIWPPAQFVNFYFLSTKYRVLYDSSISLLYDIYASYIKNALPVDGTS